jgi:hypothetical protein
VAAESAGVVDSVAVVAGLEGEPAEELAAAPAQAASRGSG